MPAFDQRGQKVFLQTNPGSSVLRELHDRVVKAEELLKRIRAYGDIEPLLDSEIDDFLKGN